MTLPYPTLRFMTPHGEISYPLPPTGVKNGDLGRLYRMAVKQKLDIPAAELKARIDGRLPQPPQPLEIDMTKPKKPAVSKVTAALFAKIDPRTIGRSANFNPRFDFGDIEGLARSIQANGLLIPLRLKPLDVESEGKRYKLIDGDRRLTAIEFLMKEGVDFSAGIDAIIVDKSQDDTTSLFQMFETNTAKAFLPLEKAMAFKTFRDAGLSIEEIERRTGCSDNDVSASLALLEADESLVKAVKEGTVSGGLAKTIATAAKGDKKKQADLTQAAVTAGKDKDKKREVMRQVDVVRREKAQKRGGNVKMRMLSDVEVSALGTEMSTRVHDIMQSLGLNTDSDLRAWAAADPELYLAFTFGALEALKKTAGLDINLTLDKAV